MSGLPVSFTIVEIDGQPFIEAPAQDHLQAPFRRPLARFIEAEHQAKQAADDRIKGRIADLKSAISNPLTTMGTTGGSSAEDN